MNVTGTQPMGSPQQMGKPPSADEMALNMVSAVEDGNISAEELVENLESRFGVDASSVLADDGTIDETALTELLSSFDPANQAAGAGAMPPPPPPPGGAVSSEELQAKLTEDYGEDAISAVFNDDGTVNFDELMTLLSSNQGSTETGLLINASA
ncbi:MULTISPECIES: hypothetical protein [unclassified Neptuniibacter]|uniref:hypothetical protein n=1 Tax=unclassified Neptuniibacter TaxID=2630693 RepID=UPI0026E1A0C5|nr:MULTISPECIES: hypothetical protein [unclassified Neptuniibacter]MDO6515076.1 hypothetical protein [Neptuniibacter sp. 2_MG-2023]MDO6594868.1 hypothetical protein [Neptuniibacter sp. 1_MG-2023]